jgi:hypothetical protein
MVASTTIHTGMDGLMAPAIADSGMMVIGSRTTLTTGSRAHAPAVFFAILIEDCADDGALHGPHMFPRRWEDLPCRIVRSRHIGEDLASNPDTPKGTSWAERYASESLLVGLFDGRQIHELS